MDIKRGSAGKFWWAAVRPLKTMFSGVNHRQKTKYDKDDATCCTDHDSC